MEKRGMAMRHWRPAAAMAVIIFVMAFSPHLSAEAALQHFDPETAEDSFINLPGTPIYTDSLTAAQVLENVLAAYGMLPETVRCLLVQNNCRIYLSQTACYDDPDTLADFLSGTEGSTAAAAVTLLGTIYHQGSTITRAEGMPYIVYFSSLTEDGSVLIHEVGHVLDYLVMLNSGIWRGSRYGISDSEEWRTIYLSDGESIAAVDSLSQVNTGRSAGEGFAEAFRLFCIYPGALYEASPAAYEYVMNIVDGLASAED